MSEVLPREATSSQPQDLFVELFAEAFGMDKVRLLSPEDPVRDIDGTMRYVDFALRTATERFAFEIDGLAWHHPDAITIAKFEDDLLRQNSLIHDNWRVYRWTDRQVADDGERVKEQSQCGEEFCQRGNGNGAAKALHASPIRATTEIQRHRAAIRRSDFSLPLKCVLRDSLLDRDDSLFDYGCGHGDDIRHLQGLGFDCDGWDPVHRPDVPRRPADAVNLGYVLNVIEDLQERAQTLRDAWQLCRKVLVVAARISVGDGGEFGAEYGDGVLTRLGTFQKLYTQAELREYLQGVLETEAVPAAPGVFYVFKDGELSQRYFAARYRRRGATPRQRISERRFEEHRPLLEPLMAKIAELGRLPFPDELSESQALIAAFGSLKRAFALIRRVTGDEEWERLRQERIDDLTVYLALARFRKRPPISSLPLDLQRDIREFFGTYTRACETADACLFRLGDPEAVDQACQRSPVGRLTSNALFVHKSAVAALEPALRIYEGCARAYLGEIDDANVVKLHRFSGKVSYLACPDFDTGPHPAILRTVKLSLRSRELDCRDHTHDEAPLVLDQKERMVDHDHPLREKFARFTEQERSARSAGRMIDLSTRRQWELSDGRKPACSCGATACCGNRGPYAVGGSPRPQRMRLPTPHRLDAVVHGSPDSAPAR